MPSSRAKIIFGIIGLAWLAAFALRLSADEAMTGAAYGYVDRINYDPPNQHHVKTELSGSEATPIPNSGGKALLKGVTIKQFPVTGGNPQMIAETPECVYDPRHKEVSSAGSLKVHAQEGKIFVEGTGFLLQQTVNRLTISNDVHSVLLSQSGTNSAVTNTMEIFSNNGEFQMKNENTNGSATYRGNVRVDDPKMKLLSESLVADLPKQVAGKVDRVQHIVAETNVVIDFINETGERTHATGERAVYDEKILNGVTNQAMELTGNPRIVLTNGWMTADVFVVDRTTGKLLGRDHFHFHYVAADQAAKTNAPAELDIWSDRFSFDLDSRAAKFWGNVHAADARMNLVAESVNTVLPKSEPGKSGRPDHILAETNVVIDLVDETNAQHIHATGQSAVYDYNAGEQTNEVLKLSGNPAVETSPISKTSVAATNKPSGWMTADVITFDRTQGRIRGVGNHHSVLKKQSGEPSTMDTEIFSDRFDFAIDTGLAVYQGNVRAYDPELNLASQELTIKLARGAGAATNRIESIFAKGSVAMDFVDKPFANGDITNLTAFVARMKTPDNAVATYVSSQLAPATMKLLDGFQKSPDGALQAALILDLNRLAQSGTVYESNRFDGVFLSLDTTSLLKSQPLGIDLVQLNRLLLLDAFRGQISRDKKGEKTHATGDEATYTYHAVGGGTNQVLTLKGHPRLDNASGWITAEDSIIDDRTTGIVHFIGHPVSHIKMEGLITAQPAPRLKKKKQE